MPDGAIVGDAGGRAQVARVLLDAEIRSFEQFLDENDLRATLRRFAHQPLGSGDVAVDVPAAGELHGRDGDLALGAIQVRRLTHANTFPGFRMPFGSSACLSSRMVEISAGVRDSGR